jgi:hypothetical protein
MATEIPLRIRQAMQAKGYKNLRQLSLAMGHPVGSTHRVFAGQNNHTTLRTYKRIADLLGWSLEQFFGIAEGNQPENIGQFLRGRLKFLGISSHQFRAYLGGSTKGGGNWEEYLSGGHKYERLRLYSSMRTALGFTADQLHESLIIFGSLTQARGSEKLLSSSGTDLVNTYSVRRAS